MNRNLLIVIGLACAVITAVGIMWYHNPLNTARRQMHANDYLIRIEALNTLYTLGGKSSIPEIIRLLKDDNELVREVAIWSVKQLGLKESIPLIKSLLEDEDEWVNHYAEQALRQFGVSEEEIKKARWTKKNIIKLRQQLHDNDVSVRGGALEWLCYLDDKESIPEIKKLLNDENEHLRQDASNVLFMLGVPEEEIQKAKESK
jgi:HEAT repeat protein